MAAGWARAGEAAARGLRDAGMTLGEAADVQFVQHRVAATRSAGKLSRASRGGCRDTIALGHEGRAVGVIESRDIRGVETIAEHRRVQRERAIDRLSIRIDAAVWRG